MLRYLPPLSFIQKQWYLNTAAADGRYLDRLADVEEQH